MEIIKTRASFFDSEENVLWMVTACGASLIKINLATWTVQEAYEVPCTGEGKSYNFISMYKDGDSIILAPYNDENVVFFDNEKKRNLKNDMIISLLIKFICRYLPYMSKEDIEKIVEEKVKELTKDGIGQ